MARAKTKVAEPQAAEARNPVGRPSTYDPAYCDRILVLAAEGLSEAEVAKELGVPRTTLRSWGDQHPEFSSALSHARDLSLAWWERQGREGIHKGSAFNAPLWSKCVAGRFPNEPYRERFQIAGPGDGPIQTEEVSDHDRAKAILALMGRLRTSPA